jgi:hypothetical protein
VFNVSIKELLVKSATFMRRLFRDMLQTVKRKMPTNPNDYIRLNIRHPSLDSDIWIEFTQSKNLNQDKILQKIQSIQHFKKEFLLTDGAMELDFFHVQYPQGSGGAKRNHLHLDKENFKKKKQAIIQINNPWDSLCLPRTIVVARLHAQKPEVSDPEWEKKWLRMRKGDHDSTSPYPDGICWIRYYPTLRPGGMGKNYNKSWLPTTA